MIIIISRNNCSHSCKLPGNRIFLPDLIVQLISSLVDNFQSRKTL